MLDNSVAGGIPSGMGMFESMVKECMEEASLEAAIVEKYARAAGVISYFFRCVYILCSEMGNLSDRREIFKNIKRMAAARNRICIRYSDTARRGRVNL